MERTGMFLPKRVEGLMAFATVSGKVVLLVVMVVCAIGGAFLLRQYTVNHLPLWKDSNLVVLAVLPEDQPIVERRMADVLSVEEIRARLKENNSYVAYLLPTDYVMQGLIANTGGAWMLYMHHHTMARFADWIFHPFGHLGGGQPSVFDAAHHSEHSMASGSVRRLIFLRVSKVVVNTPSDVFAIDAVRTPDFMVDLDVHTLKVLDLKSLPVETAWGRVPTPAF
jgi:hypothetical protein